MSKKLVIVLDSNEIILGLKASNSYSKSLIDNLSLLEEFYDFRINDQIFKEVLRNLPYGVTEKFKRLLNIGVIQTQSHELEKTLINKYKNLGLKKGDISIAAYVDKVNASILISENRHFLKELKTKKFKIVNAEQFFKNILK